MFRQTGTDERLHLKVWACLLTSQTNRASAPHESGQQTTSTTTWQKMLFFTHTLTQICVTGSAACLSNTDMIPGSRQEMEGY